MFISDESMESLYLCPNDLHILDHEPFEGYELDCARMDLVENFSPSIVKDKSCAFDEDYLSDYCRFTQVLLSLPPMGDVKIDLDLEAMFSCCDGHPSEKVSTTR